MKQFPEVGGGGLEIAEVREHGHFLAEPGSRKNPDPEQQGHAEQDHNAHGHVASNRRPEGDEPQDDGDAQGNAAEKTEDASGNTQYDWTYDRASTLSLTPEGIGVFLRVTPMINEDTGEIILVVNPKSSSTSQSAAVGDGTEYNLDPEVRASKSIIKVRDGETVVLGGLIKTETDITKTKVPVLGDIPVLGMLFRGKDQSKNIERELLVFITPHIMKDEASPLSSRKKAKVPTSQNRQRSQANKVTLFTRHEAVNTALNNFDDR